MGAMTGEQSQFRFERTKSPLMTLATIGAAPRAAAFGSGRLPVADKIKRSIQPEKRGEYPNGNLGARRSQLEHLPFQIDE